MLKTIMNTLSRLTSESPKEQPIEEVEHTYEQLIQWATGCMWEGLPDEFHTAWVDYVKSEGKRINISYRCILNEGDEETNFSPADELYPVQCINKLDAFLPKNERNWKSCRIQFSPVSASITYK